MYNLIILTPALCRPDIHDKVMPNIIKMILNSAVIDEIRYFINIDNVSGIKQYSQEETKNNFINYFAESKIIPEFNLSTKPCFFTAVKTLIEMATPHINQNSIIFYLEDDWYLDDIYVNGESGKYKFDEIINTHFSSQSFISFKKLKKQIKLPYQFIPSLWGYELFDKVFKIAIYKNMIQMDPEKCVKEYIIANFQNINFTMYQFALFYDIGREWQTKNNLIKWTKDRTNQNITYK